MQLLLKPAFHNDLVKAIGRHWADPASLGAKNVRSIQPEARSALALVADMGGVVVLRTTGHFEVCLHDRRKRDAPPHLSLLTPSILRYAIEHARDRGAPVLSQLLPQCGDVRECPVCDATTLERTLQDLQEDGGSDLSPVACPLCEYWTEEVQARYVDWRSYAEQGIDVDPVRFTAGCICRGRRCLTLDHYPQGIARPAQPEHS